MKSTHVSKSRSDNNLTSVENDKIQMQKEINYDLQMRKPDYVGNAAKQKYQPEKT